MESQRLRSLPAKAFLSPAVASSRAWNLKVAVVGGAGGYFCRRWFTRSFDDDHGPPLVEDDA
jgi:hypothetical protein